MKQKMTRLMSDGLLLIGLCIFIVGLSMAWRPLGFIVGGLILAAVAFFFGYGAARFRRPD